MPKRDETYLKQKKDEIFAAAKRTAVEKGLAKTSLRDIAANSDMSLGSISNHFPKRQNIIAYAAEQSGEEKRELLNTLLGTEDPLDQLRDWMLRMLGSRNVESGPMLDIELFVESSRDTEVRSIMSACTQESADAIAAALDQRSDPGSTATSRDTALMFLALYYGVSMMKIVDAEPSEQCARHTLDLILGEEGGC